MKKQVLYPDEYYQDKFFLICLKISGTDISKEKINTLLDLSGDMDSGSGNKFMSDAVWMHSSWIKGSMRFFDEAENVLKWIHRKKIAFSKITESGGTLDLLIGLPGNTYSISTLSYDLAHFSMELDVNIRVEVFPHLEFGNMDLEKASAPRMGDSDMEDDCGKNQETPESNG